MNALLEAPERADDAFMAGMLRGLERISAPRAAGEARPERRDFLAFARAILRDKKGRALPFGAYNRLMADALPYCHARRLHLGHMAPPGISKSTTIRAFLCWLLGNDPTLATVVISAEEKVASRQVGMCRKLILSPAFREIFPEVRPDMNRGDFKAGVGEVQGWKVKEFFFQNAVQSPDPAMAADAATPKSEARRVNALFADDLMSRAVANSTAMREEIIESATETWKEGRLSEDGWMAATHNCWTPDDYLHRVLTDVSFLSLWVGVNEDCGSLFVWVKNAPEDFPLYQDPDRYEAVEHEAPEGFDRAFRIPLPEGRANWTQEHLQAKRDNPFAAESFRKLFMLRAMQATDLMFPAFATRKRFDGAPFQWVDGQLSGGLAVFDPANAFRFQFGVGVDLAGGKRAGDVVELWGRNSRGEKMPLEIHYGNFTIEQLADILDSIWRRGFHFGIAKVEDNGTQAKIIEGIKASAQMRALPWWGTIQPFHTDGKGKVDPEIGLPAINVQLGTGMIVWPSRVEGPHWARLESEFKTCPRLLPPGSTPDGPMGGWFANRALDEIPMGGSSGKIERVRSTSGYRQFM